MHRETPLGSSGSGQIAQKGSSPWAVKGLAFSKGFEALGLVRNGCS